MQFTLRGLLLTLALVAAALSIHDRHGDRTVVAKTGRELDLAIVGDGYFGLSDFETGAKYYTRDGRFRLNLNGVIEWAGDNTRSLQVEPAIQVPALPAGIVVESDGRFLAKDQSNLVQVGQLQLYRFIDNERHLVRSGPGELYETSPDVFPQAMTPGFQNTGLIQQGWLEESDTSLSFFARMILPATIVFGCAFAVGIMSSQWWRQE